jgi:hypothetical protein
MEKRLPDQKKMDILKEQKKAAERPGTRKQKVRGDFTGKSK